MGGIRVFEEGSWERARLEHAAELFSKMYSSAKFRVAETYFDYSAGMMWTTILCDAGKSWGEFQFLYPTAQEKILNSHPLDLKPVCSRYLTEQERFWVLH